MLFIDTYPIHNELIILIHGIKSVVDMFFFCFTTISTFPPVEDMSVARGFIMLKPTKNIWRIKKYLTLLLYFLDSE